MLFPLNEKKRKREDIHFVLQIQQRHKGCIVLALPACRYIFYVGKKDLDLRSPERFWFPVQELGSAA